MSLLSGTQEMLYFQNAAGRLFHHPQGFVRLLWTNERVPIEAVKAFYEQVLALMLNSGARKILSDHGQRAPLSGPIQQWLTENWIPRAISQARAQHCAIVDGADPLHRLSTQSVIVSSPTGLIFRRFPTSEAAEAWLLVGRI